MSSSCHLRELNPGGEDNNHSSQPPKLNPIDILFYLCYFPFLTIVPNFLASFAIIFCWFEGFASILQVNGGFFLGFYINEYG
jgi:hypothetical protein